VAQFDLFFVNRINLWLCLIAAGLQPDVLQRKIFITVDGRFHEARNNVLRI
jgi:hypothetical protein